MYPLPSEASIDATAGLQISQPRPVPCAASTSENVLEAVDPHDVEQLLAGVGEVLAQVVLDLDAGLLQLVVQQLGGQGDAAAAAGAGLGGGLERAHSVMPSAMAAQIAPLLTLLQEQIVASADSEPTPTVGPPAPVVAGKISCSGCSGVGMSPRDICRSVWYMAASPTRIPPSTCGSASRRASTSTRRRPDDQALVDVGHRVAEGDGFGPHGGAERVAEAGHVDARAA